MSRDAALTTERTDATVEPQSSARRATVDPSTAVCTPPSRLELLANFREPADSANLSLAADGSFFVLGSFRGAVTFGAGGANATTLRAWGPFHQNDIFVAKYTAEGALLWARRAGGRRLDEPHKVIALRDGGALITGSYFDEARFGPIQRSDATLAVGGDLHTSFVARYDARGHVMWARRFDGTDEGSGSMDPDRVVRDMRLFGLASAGDGSAMVVGSIVGTLRFDGAPESTLRVQGKWSAFVARFDPSGVLQWAHSLRGNDEVLGLGVAADGDDALVFGTFRGDATFDNDTSKLTAVGGKDGLLARYSATGGLRWARVWGGEGTEVARLFTVDATGTAWSLGESNTARSSELFLASHDERGAECSRTKFAKTSPRGWVRMATTATQRFLIGMFSSELELVTAAEAIRLRPRGSGDFYVAAIGPDGRACSAVQVASPGVSGPAVEGTADGSLLLVGVAGQPGQLSLGEHSLALREGLFVAKLSR